MNKKIAVTGILLIVFSWIGNFMYFQSYQLEEPLFMEHYYDRGLRELVSFEIRYLINKNDNVNIYRIDIPGIPSERIRVSEQYSIDYVQHNLGVMVVEITDEEMHSWLNEDGIVFNEMTVYFNNGTSQQVDIGEIKIQKREAIDWEERALSQVSGGGSSNGNSYSLHKVEESLKVLSFEYDNKRKLEGFLHLYMNPSKIRLEEIMESESAFMESINEEDLKSQEELRRTYERMRDVQGSLFQIDGLTIKDIHFPMEFNSGEQIKISYYFDSTEEHDQRYHLFIDIEAMLLIETVEGVRRIQSLYIQNRPQFSSRQIRQIIKERR
ncbi:hypothetical protein [Alkaliphilus metalliredigens]|uniref:hypothetical protein n=1 Tax=Alkaliphilus metalliredigens TaxID=208226 RepID=UPI0005A11193|nr:hypothetical protein [Alkaliphilus metalliredigens]